MIRETCPMCGENVKKRNDGRLEKHPHDYGQENHTYCNGSHIHTGNVVRLAAMMETGRDYA